MGQSINQSVNKDARIIEDLTELSLDNEMESSPGTSAIVTKNCESLKPLNPELEPAVFRDLQRKGHSF